MPNKFIDITGNRYERLVVIEYAGKAKDRGSLWKVVCDCGNTSIVHGGDIRKGHTKSCGCLFRESHTTHALRHGESILGQRSPEYRTWQEIKTRCFNSNTVYWKNYGGRGITMCQEWRDNFEAFLRDMGRRPPGTSIDRINNDGNYEPGNCRWATRKEQNSNTRRSISATCPEAAEFRRKK